MSYVQKIGRFVAAFVIVASTWSIGSTAAQVAPPKPPATSPSGTATAMDQADALAAQALAAPAASAEVAPPPKPKAEISLWQLAQDGGPLMYPIYAMSIFVVCFAFERAFGLRDTKLLPPMLVHELGELAKRSGGVDPRAAYRVCTRHPSTAATVLKSVLLKIGRPYAEMELTLKEANEREAARLYKNVRPIELAISVAPLLGLLGTVQGMIMAFFVTANSELHGNKAEQLAQGIYVALVTTFAGLCVAIPAAVLAHYFEGRIQNFFRELDELVLSLLPQWERYEGKLRVNSKTLAGETDAAPNTPAAPPIEPPPIERHPAQAGHS